MKARRVLKLIAPRRTVNPKEPAAFWDRSTTPYIACTEKRVIAKQTPSPTPFSTKARLALKLIVLVKALAAGVNAEMVPEMYLG